MKFPWQRRAEDAEASAAKVEDVLETVKEQRRQADYVAQTVRQIRDKDYLAEAIASLMGGTKP